MPKRRYVQKDELKNRLAKIQGQVTGIQRMLEEGRPEDETLVQISALRSALDQLAARLLTRHLCDRLGDSESRYDETLLLLRRLLR
jgi:DNA-binding FrmR family transcriptional regulator